MNTSLKIILVTALLIVTVVIPLGAFTRLSDAGLGCPDWPGCYGFIDFRDAIEHVDQVNAAQPGALRESHKTWPEMVHRYFASSLGLLIVMLMIGAFWVSRKNIVEAKSWGRLPVVLFVLVCFQGLLGAWTVTMKLYPPTVVAHLYGGFLTFSLLSLLTLKVFQWEPLLRDTRWQQLRGLSLFCLIVLLIQIGLGGWMSANYAALVCTDLPICEAGWSNKIALAEAFSAPYESGQDYEFGLLSHDARVTIHILHRIFAAIFSLVALVLIFQAMQSTHAATKKLALALFALLLIQVLLGLSNVIFSLPISVATAHNGVGALLMALLILMNYLGFKGRAET